jgi:ankyrin repeat protein
MLNAASRNDPQTIAALAYIGVNVNLNDMNGRTPLMVAASEGNLEAL